jgi:hypothetical protein
MPTLTYRKMNMIIHHKFPLLSFFFMEKVSSVQIILHENYDDLTLENDICLLHLRHEVTLGPVVGKLAAR